jgi:hypothetical protein
MPRAPIPRTLIVLAVLGAGVSYPPQASATFKVSPTLLRVHRSGGQAALGTIGIDLRGERGRRFRVVVQDIRQLPDGSQTYESASASPYSASSWVSVNPSRFAGSPNRTQPVQYRVRVPADAEPGDHLTSLTVQRLQRGGQATAAPVEAVSVRLAIRVPGQAKPAATIAQLDVPGIAGGGPVGVGATVRNTGNVTLDFDGASPGRIEILDGEESVATLPFTGELFPGETRTFALSWESPPLFGHFEAAASVDTGRPTAEESARFWVIPWRKIGALILVVLAALTVAAGVRRRRWG